MTIAVEQIIISTLVECKKNLTRYSRVRTRQVTQTDTTYVIRVGAVVPTLFLPDVTPAMLTSVALQVGAAYANHCFIFDRTSVT